MVKDALGRVWVSSLDLSLSSSLPSLSMSLFSPLSLCLSSLSISLFSLSFPTSLALPLSSLSPHVLDATHQMHPALHRPFARPGPPANHWEAASPKQLSRRQFPCAVPCARPCASLAPPERQRYVFSQAPLRMPDVHVKKLEDRGVHQLPYIFRYSATCQLR